MTIRPGGRFPGELLGKWDDRDQDQDDQAEDDADTGPAPGGQPPVVIFPRVKPRMAITVNSTSEQVLRIFGGQIGWLVTMAIRATTAAASLALHAVRVGLPSSRG